ncbi:uncharacterized protein BDW43DRAFT_262897 [Aspergillus alliaceus]|uniref:uncharacterized protein n=1 Tax=Petromyces alliaceus TaxID=209559 RepID=UPI0012A5F62D|nr:uncharacterized protein BDW43DRAFT_262897 [Aspergillus alliaceus]KAB8238030.1 hypothetical protein BDW43DRAFT_262897 [Aspergillus alliaceus]
MSPRNENTSPPNTGRSPSHSSGVEDGGSRFAFVTEGTLAEARSHAMREHWRQRQRRKQKFEDRRSQRKILPQTSASPRDSKTKSDSASESVVEYHNTEDVYLLHQRSSTRIKTRQANYGNGNITGEGLGVPTQALTGLNHALASSRLDPFEMFPVQLTSKQHKLLHHWLITHATMMFEDVSIPSFNPMKDVWFPLDLSNAASFYGIMAHSAAHLAHLYAGMNPVRGTKSTDALRYKAEAVRILTTWMTDPEKSLSNDAFAAVLRLLTFERYWGTEEEWMVHRTGLQRMIEARGGIDKLHDNWRLELVVYLVSLMSRPSWFESSNNLSEISEQSFQNAAIAASVDTQKVRCLWLISFIQDMRTLMAFSSRLYIDGLASYPALHDAVLLLRSNFYLANKIPSNHTSFLASDYDRLTCLFSICITMQESMSRSPASTVSPAPDIYNDMALLDVALSASREVWNTSVYSLRAFLHHHFVAYHPDGVAKIDYVMKMTDVLGYLSLEARRGVEKCLLNMLCRARDGKEPLLTDDGWTPDSLLSSVRGQ